MASLMQVSSGSRLLPVATPVQVPQPTNWAACHNQNLSHLSILNNRVENNMFAQRWVYTTLPLLDQCTGWFVYTVACWTIIPSVSFLYLYFRSQPFLGTAPSLSLMPSLIEFSPLLASFPVTTPVPVSDPIKQTALTASASLLPAAAPISAVSISHDSLGAPPGENFVPINMAQAIGVSEEMQAVHTKSVTVDGLSLPPLASIDTDFRMKQIPQDIGPTYQTHYYNLKRCQKNTKATGSAIETLVKRCKLTGKITTTPDISHNHNSESMFETPYCARSARKRDDQMWETIWTNWTGDPETMCQNNYAKLKCIMYLLNSYPSFLMCE